MKAILISASNIKHIPQADSTSYKICQVTVSALQKRAITDCAIVNLRDHQLSPCIGCGKCYDNGRCAIDSVFNYIYEEIIQSDVVFIVSPHYAPIPAKLCMLLEKMEQITFLHWAQDNSYKSEVYGIPTGIISHGGGSGRALDSYKKMVNDTIANALDTIQLKIIPLNQEWNTGISLPVENVEISSGSVFPIQKYNWDNLGEKISEYVEAVVSAYHKRHQ